MTEFEANPYALAGELCLLIAGLALLWRHGLSPTARREPAPARLAPWEVPASDFVIFLLLILCGGFVAALLGGYLAGALHLQGDGRTAFNGAAFQFGMLTGAVGHTLVSRRAISFSLSHSDLLAGLATFLITLPVATAVGLAWAGLLKFTGLPAERQDLIEMFAHAKSPAFLGALIALATLVAPVTEELVFRAGVFRYFRTRLPRWGALVLPGMIFGSLHVNWSTGDGLASLGPLVALAIIFSLAYERTGRIAVPIVAHGLFNLHTIALIFAGVAQ